MQGQETGGDLGLDREIGTMKAPCGLRALNVVLRLIWLLMAELWSGSSFLLPCTVSCTTFGPDTSGVVGTTRGS